MVSFPNFTQAIILGVLGGLVFLGIIYVIIFSFYGEVLGSYFDDSGDSIDPDTSRVFTSFLLIFIVLYLAIFIAQIFDAKSLAREWNEYVELHNGARPW